MATATVSPKYQIVIPKEVRERLDIKPGQRVAVIDRDGYFAVVPKRPVSELEGILKGASRDGIRDKTDRF